MVIDTLDKKVNIKIGADFEPLVAGVYTVQISDVNSLMSFNQWQGKEVEVLKYTFVVLNDVLVAEKIPTNEMSRGRLLWSNKMSPSLHPKSSLFKMVKGVYGRDLTKAEAEKFDPESLIGKQVDVVVEQNPSKDGLRIFNNIVSYIKTSKLLAPVEQKVEEVIEKETRSAFVPPELSNDPFPKKKEKKITKDTTLKEVLEDEDEE